MTSALKSGEYERVGIFCHADNSRLMADAGVLCLLSGHYCCEDINEEKVLEEGLEDCADYKKRVRFGLLPFVGETGELN